MNCHYAFLERDALLHITGPDSLTFLQGQTTCDTRDVSSQRAAQGAYCTPQGRVVCDFLLSQLGYDHYALRMNTDIMENSAAVFGKYIIFSKAELDCQRDDWQVLSVWGNDAAAALGKLFPAVPGEQMGSALTDDSLLIQVDEHGQQFECYLNSGTNGDKLTAVRDLFTASTEDKWRALAINNGIARIEAPIVEEFVPQTLNYDLTGHINFSKGCYTGQEVVARLHYRGTPKRRTYLAEVPGNALWKAGTALYGAGENAQSIGNIINCVSAEDQTLALVAATATGVTAGLHIGSPDGPLLVIRALPYSLEPAERD